MGDWFSDRIYYAGQAWDEAWNIYGEGREDILGRIWDNSIGGDTQDWFAQWWWVIVAVLILLAFLSWKWK